ncbi:unnamed protein product [Cylicocyclus nassatus]|uniref:CWH43-like N-terminal domain-containing protein n=1 Tax=Cylicocyclus nassatus TaxID=53992 RepID=A0AA36M937_CYLNA|nr:unnamed protein product [Cylicocyclus nassatus]
MSAFFYILTFCAVHLQVVEFYGHSLHWRKGWWYITSLLVLIAGLAGAFGLTLAANFCYSEGDGSVHLVGSALAFVGMLLYGWGHVITR